MSFTADQKLDICTALDIDIIVLDRQLRLYADYIPAEAEAKVLTELTTLQAGENNFASFTATESNKGFNLNASSAKRKSQKKIAKLLVFRDLNFGSTRTVLRG